MLAIFFNTTTPTVIYTLSLHDALPISCWLRRAPKIQHVFAWHVCGNGPHVVCGRRSEEHTSELQSHHDLVCRLLLEKKKVIDSTKPGRRRHHTTTTELVTHIK